jgi:hypothetical protein
MATQPANPSHRSQVFVKMQKNNECLNCSWISTCSHGNYVLLSSGLLPIEQWQNALCDGVTYMGRPRNPLSPVFVLQLSNNCMEPSLLAALEDWALRCWVLWLKVGEEWPSASSHMGQELRQMFCEVSRSVLVTFLFPVTKYLTVTT